MKLRWEVLLCPVLWERVEAFVLDHLRALEATLAHHPEQCPLVVPEGRYSTGSLTSGSSLGLTDLANKTIRHLAKFELF